MIYLIQVKAIQLSSGLKLLTIEQFLIWIKIKHGFFTKIFINSCCFCQYMFQFYINTQNFKHFVNIINLFMLIIVIPAQNNRVYAFMGTWGNEKTMWIYFIIFVSGTVILHCNFSIIMHNKHIKIFWNWTTIQFFRLRKIMARICCTFS